MKFQSLWLPLTAAALLGVVEGFTAPIATQKQQHATKISNSCLMAYDYALLFDCDGVILETEEFHRLAYNAAFENAGLTIDGEPVVWSVEYYGASKKSLVCSMEIKWYPI